MDASTQGGCTGSGCLSGFSGSCTVNLAFFFFMAWAAMKLLAR